MYPNQSDGQSLLIEFSLGFFCRAFTISPFSLTPASSRGCPALYPAPSPIGVAAVHQRLLHVLEQAESLLYFGFHLLHVEGEELGGGVAEGVGAGSVDFFEDLEGVFDEVLGGD